MESTPSITSSACATTTSQSDREPDLILLDLNLPGLDGCQVLKRIKSDPFLRMIPVVILTTSNREEDILQTYQAGANTYITKPDEYPRYRELVATLEHYWVDTALKVPRHLMRSRQGSDPPDAIGSSGQVTECVSAIPARCGKGPRRLAGLRWQRLNMVRRYAKGGC